MIYKLEHDYENTYSLLIDPVEMVSKMPTYKPRQKAKSVAHEWVAPEASFFKSENFAGSEETIPDVTMWKLGYLVLSPKAYEKLKVCLSPSGEFLPITIDGKTFYLFSPLYIIADKATDKSNAVDIIDSGVHLGQGNVTFDEALLKKENITVFKTNTDKLVFSYCTEVFKGLIEDNGFKGLVFEGSVQKSVSFP
jgi:hypothetical protein